MDYKSHTFKEKASNEILNEKIKFYQKPYIRIINSKIKVLQEMMEDSSCKSIEYENKKAKLIALMDIRQSINDIERFAATDVDLLDMILDKIERDTCYMRIEMHKGIVKGISYGLDGEDNGRNIKGSV